MKKPNMPSMPAVPKFDFRALAEDFKSLDPKDIGTWPLLPRVTVLLGVFAALLVAGGEQFLLFFRMLHELHLPHRFELRFVGKLGKLARLRL